MHPDRRTIPLPIVKLLIGYFSQTNNDTEKDVLAEWLDEDDGNMEVFDECLDVTSRPFRYDPERDDAEMGLRCAADVLMKHLKNTISAEERKWLDDWLSLSEQNKKIFSELPQTDDMEVLYHWLRQKSEIKTGLNLN